MAGTPHEDQNVLCLRHADAMSVPRGWTLDDRREEVPRLFMPRPATPAEPRQRQASRGPRRSGGDGAEQLVIDGTGEIERPPSVEDVEEPESAPTANEADSWRPDFDHDSNLDGLLEVSSPLLARAFRGTDRPRD